MTNEEKLAKRTAKEKLIELLQKYEILGQFDDDGFHFYSGEVSLTLKGRGHAFIEIGSLVEVNEEIIQNLKYWCNSK